MGMPEFKPNCIDRCDAITDIIESVALEQAALSHILNAEGEKLQAVIHSRCSTETLLKTNCSVQSMVESITRLEIVLQSKLSLFEKCLCDYCDHKPPKPPHKSCDCD
ncbi:MAG: hypothetical protein PHD46_06325 [Eubacteriales bacterium]|nr:hypothetical protein [Eubacteriales bacterium]